MTTDTTIDAAAAARPVQRDRAASASMPRNADGMPEAQADMSFWDVLDVVNPLQHIPIVNSIYRAVTGDEINAPARVMGGILFGGVIGGAAAIANAVLEQSTGHDLGGHMLASLGFEDKPAAAAGATAVAEAGTQGKAPTPGAPTAAPGAAGGTAAAAATAVPPATPQTLAAAANAALRPTASAVPPTDAAARLQAAANGLPLRDALASPTGDHRPSKMPARDTIPANTMQAKQAAAMANQQRFARLGDAPGTPAAATAKPTAAVAPPQAAPAAGTAPAAAQQAAEASATPAPAAQAAAAQAASAPNGVPPAMLPDVMMRNLAKYEAARRAAAAKAGPGTRVDG
ncbi:hypothetical protein HL658_10665 [Azospirillum sp. RWY-5-1]|uniref:Uncharacterized protein n=1 Tax=Azospirillum oleiclasticum TaxID=2735135 RepID=A0ABX2T7Y1_9PROT|nr:hypothetical protein [Azospirillum oleiclasticum]NYZ13016.1 hypothetical protein [Azospirillum oleiclasticum]NYZ20311.1 hypothetical protein [Azospirillum oleiclasticum]